MRATSPAAGAGTIDPASGSGRVMKTSDDAQTEAATATQAGTSGTIRSIVRFIAPSAAGGSALSISSKS
jgi:hypothetical protein